MRGSIQIAKLFNIPVLVHWSFGLLAFFVLWEGFSNDLSWEGTLWLGVFVLALFLCVVMHEFGHALTARRYGVGTRDIILLPIGGVARLDRLPEKPIHEFLVAIAGPAVNIAIVLALSPLFLFSVVSFNVTSNAGGINAQNFIPLLVLLNVMLAIFNLIPAFPMDGGRILRALLSMRLGRVRATKIAAVIGQLFALAFVVSSILWVKSPMLALIGVFVFLNAWGEARSVKMNSLLDDTKLSDIMKTRFTRLHPHDTMHTAIRIMEMGAEQNFIITNEAAQSIGILHNEFIKEAMSQRDGNAPVAVYMSKHYEPLQAQDSVRFAAMRIQTNGYSIVPVEKDGQLVGVLDMKMIQEFLKENK